MPSNYLIHYGVVGMKWGERRYQNYDGSLTEEGRLHYGVGDPRSQKELADKLNKEKTGLFGIKRSTSRAISKGASKAMRNKKVKALAKLLSGTLESRRRAEQNIDAINDEIMLKADGEEAAIIKNSKEYTEDMSKLYKDLDEATQEYNQTLESLTKELLGEYGNDDVLNSSVQGALDTLASKYNDVSVYDSSGRFIGFMDDTPVEYEDKVLESLVDYNIDSRWEPNKPEDMRYIARYLNDSQFRREEKRVAAKELEEYDDDFKKEMEKDPFLNTGINNPGPFVWSNSDARKAVEREYEEYLKDPEKYLRRRR